MLSVYHNEASCDLFQISLYIRYLFVNKLHCVDQRFDLDLLFIFVGQECEVEFFDGSFLQLRNEVLVGYGINLRARSVFCKNREYI